MQAPTAAQTEENKRLLKELDEQKKRLKLQQAQPPSSAGLAAIAPSIMLPLATAAGTQPSSRGSGAVPLAAHVSGNPAAHLTQAQKAALEHAHSNSFGYFITQDSSFGNLILPVLPRLDK